MLCSEFQGADELVAMLDAAAASGDQERTTAGVKTGLEELILTGRLRLPAECEEPVGDRYARRLLYRSERYGYTVIAMTWGPTQGTPVHDHAGLWCVEAVCTGRIAIQNYAVLEHADGRFRFQPGTVHEAGEGSAGRLIPPLEYHRIFNPSDAATAVSLHVYGGEMTQCGVFVEDAQGWWTRDTRQLTTV